MTRLEKAARKAVLMCLKLKSNETAIIFIDEFTRELGQLLFKTALRRNSETILIETKAACKDNEGLPSSLRTFLNQTDAIILATSNSISQTRSIKSAIQNGARVICLSKLSLDTIERCVNTDFKFIQEKSNKLADLFSIGKKATLRAPGGTHIEIPISRRKGTAHTGIADEPGVLSRLPAGRASVMTEKGKAEGIVVVDGSLGSYGLLKKPVRFDVREGYLKKIYGGNEAEILRKIIKPFGKQARHLTEFGIGTNPSAEIKGVSNEDNTVLGTVYFTSGEPNMAKKGRSKNCQFDAILLNATLDIDGHEILKSGKILV